MSFCFSLPMFSVFADGPALPGVSTRPPWGRAYVADPQHSRSAAAVDHKERKGTGPRPGAGGPGESKPPGTTTGRAHE